MQNRHTIREEDRKIVPMTPIKGAYKVVAGEYKYNTEGGRIMFPAVVMDPNQLSVP